MSTYLLFFSADTVDIFPVASSTAFFTDMHYLLKVLSIGNVRSACHHRLRFLEEVGSVNFFCLGRLFLVSVYDLSEHRAEIPCSSVAKCG